MLPNVHYSMSSCVVKMKRTKRNWACLFGVADCVVGGGGGVGKDV